MNVIIDQSQCDLVSYTDGIQQSQKVAGEILQALEQHTRISEGEESE